MKLKKRDKKYIKKYFSFYGDELKLVWILNVHKKNLILKISGPLGNTFKVYSPSKYNLNYFIKPFIFSSFVVKSQWIKLFLADIKKLVVGVTLGWFIGLQIEGRGFNFKICKKNSLTYLRLKIGYSHFIYYELPENIFVNLSIKKTKLIFFCLNYWLLKQITHQLRIIRSRHTYKVQGISYFNEIINIKGGKQKQF